MNRINDLTRRRLLQRMAVLGGASLLPLPALRALAGESDKALIRRTIPGTDESLPVSGMGSARTFNIDPDDEGVMPRLKKVLQAFYNGGGRVLDTSPMYGTAEIVLGRLMGELELTDQFWIATKVWTRGGREAGIEQMQQSFARLGTETIDLMQVHNLVDMDVHLPTLRDWKKDGRIRYLGVTHYREDQHDALIKLVESRDLDFVQFNYNLRERNAEKRLLPACADNGVATLINEPFNKGNLFRAVKDKPLPDWAGEIDCDSWAQLFLKYIIGHPAVTAVIPATGDPEHAAENAAAGRGAVPETAMRKRILEAVDV